MAGTRSGSQREFLNATEIVIRNSDAPHQYAASMQPVKDAERDLAAALKKFEEASAEAERLSQALEKETSRRVKRKVFPERSARTQASLRSQFESARRTVAAAEAARASAQAASTAATSRRDRLRRQAHEYEAASEKRDRILADMYDGPVGSPEENAAEARRDTLAEDVKGRREKLQTQAKALRALRLAEEDLGRAIQALRNAQMSNTVDLITDGSVGLLAGASCQANLRNASAHARKANSMAKKAARINPNLKFGKGAAVDASNAGAVVDIVFDSLIGDAIIRHGIEKSLQRTRQAMSDIQKNVKVQEALVEDMRREMRPYEAELNMARAKLFEIRAALFIGPGIVKGAPS